jgi:hypothetical protein
MMVSLCFTVLEIGDESEQFHGEIGVKLGDTINKCPLTTKAIIKLYIFEGVLREHC